MITFELYHLKFRELNRLERFVKLLNPMTDDEHTKCVFLEQCAKAYDCLINVSDLRKKQPDFKLIWKKKASAAKTLLDTEYYAHVASIKAKNLPKLVKMTSHGHQLWFEKNNKDITIIESPWRETYSYDVVRFEDQIFLYLSTGWVNITNNDFTNDM